MSLGIFFFKFLKLPKFPKFPKFLKFPKFPINSSTSKSRMAEEILGFVQGAKAQFTKRK